MAIALKKQVADYEQARTQGYNVGYASGYKQGHDEGYTEGESVGYQNGHEKGFSEGKQVGYDQGNSDCAIWYFCSLCGGPVFIKPGSEEHKVIIDFFGYHSWAHQECANRSFYR